MNTTNPALMNKTAHLSWFHVILTTYGSWLPGDKRGFRTRKHREHVAGDYKNPPTSGRYEGLAAHSQNALQQEPFVLTGQQREVVGTSLRDGLIGLCAVVACLAIAGQHGHLLVKLPKAETRRWIGLAKKHAWFELHDSGWTGKLWAKRQKFVPIRDRKHQLNVYDYILRHAEQGAYLWKYSDGI